MTKVPLWTLVITGLLGVVGVVISVLMVVHPSAAPATAGLVIGEEIEPLVVGYAVRNVATALVLLIAVAIRTPTALFAALSGRLITEILDGAHVVLTGASWQLSIVVLLMFITVMILRRIWPLVRTEMANARSGATP